MAASAAPLQNFLAESLDQVTAPIATSQAINQGDLVKIASNLAVPCDTPATDVVHGVSMDTNPVSSLGDTLNKISVRRSGIHKFYLPTGTANYDDPVYLTSTNAQTVTVSSPGTGAWIVGYCRNLTAVVGGAGVVVPVEISVSPAAKKA